LILVPRRHLLHGVGPGPSSLADRPGPPAAPRGREDNSRGDALPRRDRGGRRGSPARASV